MLCGFCVDRRGVKRRLVVALRLLLVLGLPAVASAQGEPSLPQGGFPDATFTTMFRKYMEPDNQFTPYYAWDAEMSLDVTVYRRGTSAIVFAGLMQAIGTESFGSSVGVGATGYVFGGSYVRPYPDGFTFETGIIHLSSHLTRDLDRKIAEEEAKGKRVPTVDDPDQYNVPFLRLEQVLASAPLAPEFAVAIEPLNFRFNGDVATQPRPLYIATRWTLWKVPQHSVVFQTQHEVGANSLNHFSLLLELFARNQKEGRFQLFFSASPGNDIHVSPNIGAIRDGLAWGVRLRFKS